MALDGAGYGEDDFDYDEFLRRELGLGAASRRRSRTRWVAVLALVAFVVWAVLAAER